MKILAIDDDEIALSVLSWVLKQDGHEVTACTNSLDAVLRIQPGVDLVISDVSMPGLNGFEVAQLVSSRLGNAPPRTLLISGEDHEARVDQIPPDQIIGLVEKPVSLGHMHRIVRLLAYTREACPGNLTTTCPLLHAKTAPVDPDIQSWLRFCKSESYSHCPLYNENGGKALRAWIKNLNPPGTPDPQAQPASAVPPGIETAPPEDHPH